MCYCPHILLSGTYLVTLSCGVNRTCGSDPTLLRLPCRLAAVAPIHPLAWELPYAVGVALKSKKINMGVPIVAQWLMNPTRNHEVVGSIPGLAQWVKDLALP